MVIIYIYRKYCIDGGCEAHEEKDTRYFCVCVEQTNYTPISYEEVKEKIKQQQRGEI